MSSNNDPPKSQESLSNIFMPKRNVIKSLETKNKEKIDEKLVINKNLDDNHENPNQNTILSFSQNKEINFTENKLSNKEIETKEIKVIRAMNFDVEKNKKLEEENNKREFENVLKYKLSELKEKSNMALRQNCKEYYLISREWMIKLNDYIKGMNDIKFEDLKDKKNNDEFLIENEIIERALMSNQEKNKMIILKPKYSFATTLRPCPVNESYWKFT